MPDSDTSHRIPLFIEIGSEDLPARYVEPLADALAQSLKTGLEQRDLAFGEVRRFATPRRIAVYIADVAEQQPERLVQRDGPRLDVAMKDGEPTRAGLGFAKSCGVEFSALEHKNGKLHFQRREPGARTATLISELFSEALKHMDTLVPKRMHWGNGSETFVRPVRWLVALLGGEVVPLQHFELTAGRTTFGHRFHAPASIELTNGSGYEQKLRNAHVWADPDTRREAIRDGVETEAKRHGGRARMTDELLHEVAMLVEWPVVIAGGFEARFMELPAEVIIATVETNQRYFTVFNVRDELLPAFITVSNIDSKQPQEVITGNERVVRPRLADGLFFWHQDLRCKLEEYGPKLEAITFQKKLGSLASKVARNAALARQLADAMGADAAAAERAASLSKNDLVTQMVGEFPELQGLMGGYYATRSGEPQAVADAIRDHYLPIHHGGELPATPEGRAVALADKLDTLAGYFAVGQKPTASKDPFGLRRAALGIIRILVEAELNLDLRSWLQTALAAQPAGEQGEDVLGELLAFLHERQRAWSIGREVDGQIITAEAFEAVAALALTQPLDTERRLRAVVGFLHSSAAASLAAADKRARNILRQAGETPPDDIAPSGDPVEAALLAAVKDAEARLTPLREHSDYRAMLEQLAMLKAPVDRFFEDVRVMDDDPVVRAARLGLLARLDGLCREVADLSRLPG